MLNEKEFGKSASLRLTFSFQMFLLRKKNIEISRKKYGDEASHSVYFIRSKCWNIEISIFTQIDFSQIFCQHAANK